jgi:hypothetical protein
MANLRGSSGLYEVGNRPPVVNWTVVRGDTASFRVYVTDDARQPLNIPDWTIAMKIKRPNSTLNSGIITDDATLVLDLYPAADLDDAPGEFTVFLSSSESFQLESGDIFDIQLSTVNDAQVWTVAQGKMIILEDVTD